MTDAAAPAHGDDDGAPASPGYERLREADVARPYPHVHGGDGVISVAYFPFGGAPAPARFVVYDLPPGASEGMHVHRLGDAKEGAFDEYYYVVSGEGEMQIEGATVKVGPGDHVHAPLGVAHGVRNTSEAMHLKVFLTFIAREG